MLDLHRVGTSLGWVSALLLFVTSTVHAQDPVGGQRKENGVPLIAPRLEIPDDRGFSAIAIAPDGKTIAADVGDDSRICLFDSETGKIVREVTKRCHCTRLLFSPDGELLLSAEATFTIWNVRTGEAISRGASN